MTGPRRTRRSGDSCLFVVAPFEEPAGQRPCGPFGRVDGSTGVPAALPSPARRWGPATGCRSRPGTAPGPRCPSHVHLDRLENCMAPVEFAREDVAAGGQGDRGENSRPSRSGPRPPGVRRDHLSPPWPRSAGPDGAPHPFDRAHRAEDHRPPDALPATGGGPEEAQPAARGTTRTRTQAEARIERLIDNLDAAAAPKGSTLEYQLIAPVYQLFFKFDAFNSRRQSSTVDFIRDVI